ncbi:MAG TPA: hypothetical protein VNQ14_15335, partial [Woeseiaceae bacterium]|nr:hypothetical protein [Woeseiaceae bacterium]
MRNARGRIAIALSVLLHLSCFPRADAEPDRPVEDQPQVPEQPGLPVGKYAVDPDIPSGEQLEAMGA